MHILIIGAGGHAKVLLALLKRQGLAVAGIVDIQASGVGLNGLPVVGDDEWLLSCSPEHIRLVNALGSTGAVTRRARVFQRFKVAGFQFLTLVDPLAEVEADCQIGEGAQILKGAVIQTGVEIGANTIVNTGAIIDHDCNIGPDSHIAPGCILSGSVAVGACCHVGTGTVIRQNIEIGSGTVIGAGSVVVDNIPCESLAYGVPAKVISR